MGGAKQIKSLELTPAMLMRQFLFPFVRNLGNFLSLKSRRVFQNYVLVAKNLIFALKRNLIYFHFHFSFFDIRDVYCYFTLQQCGYKGNNT